MKKYFLDTSIIIDYLQGKKEIIKLINNLDGHITSSYICLAELFEGIYRSKDAEKYKKIILGLFSGFSKTYSIDQKVADKFGFIRKELKLSGKIIEDIDIFIAATCIIHDLILITQNTKHFSKVKDLRIYYFPIEKRSP